MSELPDNSDWVSGLLSLDYFFLFFFYFLGGKVKGIRLTRIYVAYGTAELKAYAKDQDGNWRSSLKIKEIEIG